MYKNISITNRGFTLIELLVVIAIIGILASVVLASLNSARSKGADAAIKSNINNMRAQAELFYDDQTTKTYTGLCANTSVVQAYTAVVNAGGTTVANGCSASGNEYRMYSILKSTPTKYYCIDSTGKALETTTAPSSSTRTCPAS